jgi:hypothetical protein
MRMLGAGVDLELLDHRVAQASLRQHALHRELEDAVGVALLQLGEVGLVDAAGISRVAVVLLVLGLGAGDAKLLHVDDHDVVAGIDVGVNSGLCLPRRRRETSAARRPRTLSVASTTNQSRRTSSGLAEKVFMVILTMYADPGCRDPVPRYFGRFVWELRTRNYR